MADQRVITDETQSKERRAQDRFTRDTEKSDFAVVMSTLQGRRLVRRIVHDICGAHKMQMGDNERWTNFWMGQQNVGLLLLTEIEEVCPDKGLLMNAEHIEMKRKEL